MDPERAPKRPKRERSGGRYLEEDLDDDADEELLTGWADDSKHDDDA
jgi:hypothetical protein